MTTSSAELIWPPLSMLHDISGCRYRQWLWAIHTSYGCRYDLIVFINRQTVHFSSLFTMGRRGENFNHVIWIRDSTMDNSDSFWKSINLCSWNVNEILLIWIHTMICVIQVVYFTALFPYAILLVLLVRSVTLPGAANGLRFLFIPKWAQLLDPNVSKMMFWSVSLNSLMNLLVAIVLNPYLVHSICDHYLEKLYN